MMRTFPTQKETISSIESPSNTSPNCSDTKHLSSAHCEATDSKHDMHKK